VEDLLALAWTESGDPSRVRVLRLGLPRESAGGGGDPSRGAREEGRPWDGQPGSLAPDYAAETLEGEAWSLRREDGRPYLLNLWATWCGPCRQEMPDLAELDREMAPRGLRVVGLSVDEPGQVEEVRRLVARTGIEYPILMDAQGRATSLFGVSSLPASFLFDGRGLLIWKSFGLVRPDDPALRKALERALGS
jgi:thiol-disulfide isomerase/thioredoxin